MRRPLSLATTVVAVVLLTSVIPLGSLGIWAARDAVISAQNVLRDQTAITADRIADGIKQRWILQRGMLLLLANNAETVRGLSSPYRKSTDDSVGAYLRAAYLPIQGSVPRVILRDSRGTIRWILQDSLSGVRSRRSGSDLQGAEPTVTFHRGIVDNGVHVGEIEAAVRANALFVADSTMEPSRNALAITSGDGTPLYNQETRLPDKDVLIVHRQIDEPSLDIAVSAAVTPYVRPFERMSHITTVAIVIATLSSIFIAIFAMRRISRPLSSLAAAADALAQGELGRHVEPRGPDEVQRVAVAFNAMSDTLRATLESLTRQEVLGAVGTFAGSLAHEVRNALSSVQVNLQRLRARDSTDEPSKTIVSELLADVQHLNSIVTGALGVARNGHLEVSRIELANVLERAVISVSHKAADLDVFIKYDGLRGGIYVNGNASGLQQMFTNLLLNAVEASQAGGRVEVSATTNDNNEGEVRIADSGTGIPAQDLHRVWLPLYSTKTSGTGLGLPMARQIVLSHRGKISLESSLQTGTTAVVVLPLAHT